MPVTGDAYALFVGGEWQEALPGGTFEVANPATGEVCAVLPDGGRAEMRRAPTRRTAPSRGGEGRPRAVRSAALRALSRLKSVVRRMTEKEALVTQRLRAPGASVRLEVPSPSAGKAEGRARETGGRGEGLHG